MKGERRKNFPRAKSKASAAKETQKVKKKKKAIGFISYSA